VVKIIFNIVVRIVLTNPSFIEARQFTTLAGLFLFRVYAFPTAPFSHSLFCMYQYILFYKPFNVLSQFSAEGDKKTLAHYLPHVAKNIYPVGRLDYDSEGLLLLTDDKALTHQLLDPSFKHKRTYFVQVEGTATNEAITKLQQGVIINIDGKPYTTKRAEAELLTGAPALPDRDPPIRYRKCVPDSWLSLTLTEGRNRQVRRMTAAVGFPTLRLLRYSIGSITIGNMQPGDTRELSVSDKQQLFNRL
jgi:23S rRNA pseudouridine2457 synthase